MRLLDLPPKELAALRGDAFVEAITRAEGRTIIAETLAAAPPLVDGVSNGELAAAFGADVILLNGYDVTRPVLRGCPVSQPGELAAFLGRPVGINLEPTSAGIAVGRRASAETIRAASDQGAAFVLLTANPGVHVSDEALLEAAQSARRAAPALAIFVGRMHGGGLGFASLPTSNALAPLLDVVDGVALPAPATVPGSRVERIADLVEHIHAAGRQAWGVVGTSQEGSDMATVREIALMAKSCGFDALHLGDAGAPPGMAAPENIMAAGIAIRGKRHTYRRMAASLAREVYAEGSLFVGDEL
jgi:hypothetical protein